MEKEEKIIESEINLIAKKFLEKSQDKEIYLISHFDTDGITSATIMIQTLKKLDKRFSVKIIKSLEEQFIRDLPKNKLILFLDLASGSLNHFAESSLKDIFIIDHHEIDQDIPANVNIINSELYNKQKISASSLTYLFCKEICQDINQYAKLAILGMIGDTLEKEIDKLNHDILTNSEIKRKRGILIYPSTRPLNRVLEFCSNPFIPGVTGNTKGVLELLRQSGLKTTSKGYPNLIDINEKEMQNLTTNIMLRNPKSKNSEMIGDIFLLKFFNKLEDAREFSAIINACSRFGESETAIQLCMEIPQAKKRAGEIHAKYKQYLVAGLKFASETEKIKGKNFMIINAKDNIRDTMIGTIASILSRSSLYEDGTIIIAMAYYDDKIKVSARMVGKNTRNIRELLNNVVQQIGGEAGGHKFAAGCMILQSKEKEFIDLLIQNLEVEIIKVQ